MKLPLYIDGATVRDATGRVIISALNPCTMAERRQIVRAVNGSAAALDALESWEKTEWMKADHHPNYNRRLLWAFHNDVKNALTVQAEGGAA